MLTSAVLAAQAVEPLRIRRACASDAATICAMMVAAAPRFTVQPDGGGAEAFFESIAVAREVERINMPGTLYLVAEIDLLVIGAVAIRDGTHLFRLFVATQFQGRGIARQLWQAAHAAALEAGNADGFTVNSAPLAVPVYQRFGFEISGPQAAGSGVHFTPMRLAGARVDE